nr:unnamed protein product [Callosobruchus analis]
MCTVGHRTILSFLFC